MTDIPKLGLYLIAVILASVAFGSWQESIHAGIFMSMLLALFVRI